MKTADFNAPPFCFLIKKKVMKEVTKSFGFFSYKMSFFLLVSAFFDKYALPLLKRNVNTTNTFIFPLKLDGKLNTLLFKFFAL